MSATPRFRHPTSRSGQRRRVRLAAAAALLLVAASLSAITLTAPYAGAIEPTCKILGPQESLRSGRLITKPCMMQSQLEMTTDGNLQWRNRLGHVIWMTGTNSPGAYARMQLDGNFVIHAIGGQIIWATGVPDEWPNEVASGSTFFGFYQGTLGVLGDYLVPLDGDRGILEFYFRWRIEQPYRTLDMTGYCEFKHAGSTADASPDSQELLDTLILAVNLRTGNPKVAAMSAAFAESYRYLGAGAYAWTCQRGGEILTLMNLGSLAQLTSHPLIDIATSTINITSGTYAESVEMHDVCIWQYGAKFRASLWSGGAYGWRCLQPEPEAANDRPAPKTPDPSPTASGDTAPPVPLPIPPTMLLIDRSGSMNDEVDPANKVTKLDDAKRQLIEFIRGSEPGTPFGLRSFSGVYDGDCDNEGTLNLPIGLLDEGQLVTEIGAIVASGSTPLPAALRAAVADTAGFSDAQVVLVSDGLSSCKAGCAEIQDNRGRYVDLTIHTVAYGVLDDKASKDLACIAEETDALFLQAPDGEALGDALQTVETFSGSAYSPPYRTRLVGSGDGFIELAWDHSGVGVHGFTVGWGRNGLALGTVGVDAGERSARIPDLNMDSDYEFDVVANGSDGTARYGPRLLVGPGPERASEHGASPPLWVEATSVGREAMEITWSHPGIDLSHFMVIWGQNDSEVHGEERVWNTSLRMLQVSDLNEGEVYEVDVVAVGGDGLPRIGSRTSVRVGG